MKKIKLQLKRTHRFFFVFLLTFTNLAIAHGAGISWSAVNNYLYRENGSTPLTGGVSGNIGSFVQLVWVGPNGNIDDATNAGDGATGDDVVVDFSYVGSGSATGDNGWFDGQTVGEGGAVLDGRGYYLRTWTQPASDFANGLVPTTSNGYYGNSSVWTWIKTSPTYDNVDFTAVASISATNQTVASATAPTVTTQAVSDITTTSATGNGTITDLGSANVTERGIYYSTTDGFSDGSGIKVSTTGDWSATGAFTQAITGLTANTTYYLKAFATNSAGTGYGSQVSFTTHTIHYVDASVSGGAGDGSSWANAFQYLQDALAVAVSGDQIWVADGIYYPDQGTGHNNNSPTETFNLIEGIKLYGGFAGTESLLSERNWSTNVTILSGDIDGNDLNTDGNNIAETYTNISGSNSYHVVYANGGTGKTNISSATELNGFYITAGAAINPDVSDDKYGGGLNCNGAGLGNESSPTIKNCNFSGNKALRFGGAIYNNGINNGKSSPIITNCSFSENFAETYSGGAVCNYAFSGISSPTIINCAFSGNTANQKGGAIYNHGPAGNSCPSITNCTFTGNSATTIGGGAIYNNADVSGTSNPSITNCILWGNSSVAGNEIYNYQGATPSVSYSNIEGGIGATACISACTDGGNNIDTNPLFANLANNDYRITGVSPCADVGNDAANTENDDIRGAAYARKLNKTDGSSGTIDMGAYEYKFGTDPQYPTLNWTSGSSTSDWNTSGNWDADLAPISSYHVTIPDVTNDPIIAVTTSANCNNLTLESGATLTINSGGSLITYGTITNNGTISVEQSISDGTWHLISIPNDNTTANTFLGDYLQYWTENGQSWTDISDPATTLTPAQGYSLWGVAKNTTYTFTGTPNTGNQSITLSYHENGSGTTDGMNLVGNPYPSSINWATLQPTYGTAYVWNPTTSDYIENIDAAIAPMQGFFIYTTTDGGTFSLANANRSHGGSFYKRGSSLSNGLVLQASYGSFFDEFRLEFDHNATDGFVLQDDAWKLLSGYEGVSQLWSVSPDGMLAIDVRPYQETIQLGFANDVAGLYTIGISEIADITSALLEDTKVNLFHDLTKGAYEFAWDVNDDENRFKLHLNVVGLEETPGIESNILIYAAHGNIFIKGAEKGEVRVSDLTGRIVFQQQIHGADIVSIPTNLKTGIYLVMVQQGKVVKTEKIFIR